MKRSVRRESGQGLIEYGLVLVVVSVALIASLTALASHIESGMTWLSVVISL